ncbi:hypothetical protein [Arthrobacter sp. M4]|uniref:hypothetical protein n=1 Tax=Arthrobacter sp. M4 TaxID=218160 RepID=UPI001CDC3C7D|nr:hypothetical protein [Arthrobacter sp. M4]MCA4134320.1 hypothetical protein [Arthrobacter sp. M4]
MSKESFAQKFMRTTGRLRVVFGPAHSSSLDHEMTAENKRLLVQRQAEAGQWETVRRPDGSTYVVPKDPTDKSLR